MKKLNIGVVGYSGQKFDEEVAKEYLAKAFDVIEELAPDQEKVVVSGLTDVGIPALAYREATKRGWKTMGVACKKAEEYDLYPVNYKTIIGEEWGDESKHFLSSIDMMVRVGGGKQALREVEEFKQGGGSVFEYDLEAKK